MELNGMKPSDHKPRCLKPLTSLPPRMQEVVSTYKRERQMCSGMFFALLQNPGPPPPYAQEVASIYKHERQTRSGMFFTLPVLLLSLRLLVHSLYTTLYGLWSRSSDGLEALDRMVKCLGWGFDLALFYLIQLDLNLKIVSVCPCMWWAFY